VFTIILVLLYCRKGKRPQFQQWVLNFNQSFFEIKVSKTKVLTEYNTYLFKLYYTLMFTTVWEINLT